MNEIGTKIFGDDARSLLQYLDDLANALTDYEYEVLPEHSLVQIPDFKEVSRIYCTEIMYRAHWAASTAILRTHRWVSSIGLSARFSNYLGFAASLRSLIESTGDIIDALMHVPLTIAEHRLAVTEMLQKRASVFHDFGALEDKLIHFTHARKLGKGITSPPVHIAKTNTDYIQQLQAAGQSFMIDCYAELCQLAHPAAPSVMAFVVYDGENLVRLNNHLDDDLIADFCRRHRDVMNRVVPLSVGSPICILKVLNLLPLNQIRTHEADTIALDIPGWRKIEEMMET